MYLGLSVFDIVGCLVDVVVVSCQDCGLLLSCSILCMMLMILLYVVDVSTGLCVIVCRLFLGLYNLLSPTASLYSGSVLFVVEIVGTSFVSSPCRTLGLLVVIVV